jgi:hypothetical protein
MDLGAMRPKLVGIAIATATVAGLAAGALMETTGRDRAADEDARSGNRPTIPPFVQFTPTATPRPDHPSPDLGNLTGVRGRDGAQVLRFDRVTLRQTGPGRYEIGNQNQRVRERTLADSVKVVGAQRLTQQPEPREVPLSRLVEYLEQSGAKRPVLAWLTYDEAGRVSEIREQNLL